MNLPPGEYIIKLEHHPNQKPLEYIATIVEGKHTGKGMKISMGAKIIRGIEFNGEKNEN